MLQKNSTMKNFKNYDKNKVANGDYSSSTDVVQEALRLLQKQDGKKAGADK